ncbi:CPBP family intramembrane glutamic endopeptidase (plasmid) [Coraliomargarita sp. W4R53]
MPEHSIDEQPPLTRAELRATGPAEYQHVARTDWREGGRTVRRWRERTLAVAFISLGAGVLAAAAIETMIDASWTPLAATGLIMLGMAVPVVWAFTRSRPAGLLRFRAVDLLYAVVLGTMLRIASGWLEVALGGTGAFPSYTTVNGTFGGSWMLTEVVAPAVVAPLVEEFFFRAVLLVSLYTVLRRPVGSAAAAITAVVVSSAVFMLVHTLTMDLPTATVLSIGMLGAVCSIVVMLTGRIWGAVLIHAVFNASYIALAIIGTLGS